MGSTNDRIEGLIIKHLKDELTVEEQLELQEWIDRSDSNREVFHQLTDPEKLHDDLQEFQEAKINIRTKIDARIKADVIALSSPAARTASRRLRVYIAAASLLIIFATSYFWLASLFYAPSKARPASSTVVAQDVAPGGSKATLTLGDGSKLVLDSAANGRLAIQGSSQITKTKDQLAYTTTALPSQITYNTLTTPRAGQYQLVLPDGTKVWLNNASSLRYPTSFAGASREVTLTGEGYFEVAKNIHPFALKVHDLTVGVLGTTFNVMAYDDEPGIKTTLISGKVSIATATKQSVLSPGEQGILDPSAGTITILKDADIEAATAWQRGYFQYTHANIGDVLRQLARWYDVEVVFTIPIPDYTFDGEIDRSLHLSTILKHLEKKDLHFHIEDKRLIVSK